MKSPSRPHPKSSPSHPGASHSRPAPAKSQSPPSSSDRPPAAPSPDTPAPPLVVPAHSLPQEELMRALGTSPQGLDERGVAAARAQHGPNTWDLEQRSSALDILLGQLKNPLILLLFVSSAVAFFTGHPIDAVGILAAIVLSVAFGFWQEYKAEGDLAALRAMSSPHAVVIRGGREQEVPAADLVPGDIIVLREGDSVPADARLIDGADLACDQAALTGESEASQKRTGTTAADTPLAERSNIAYAGTLVVRGRAQALVFATGLSTEFGRIAQKLSEVESDPTPLQKSLASLGERIGQVAVALSAAFFLFGLVQGVPWGESLLVSVALAVAAIPEGLPTVLAITLGIGVQRMAAEKALVRKLQAVETLGSATVICTDKTGTLTANQMTLVRLWAHGVDFALDGGPKDLAGAISRLDGQPLSPADAEAAREALSIGALCNDASLVFSHPQAAQVEASRGDPTEVALLVAARKAGLEPDALRADLPRVGEIPFEYARKMMTQIRQRGGHTVAYVKGAPESVLERCARIRTASGERALTAADRKAVHAQLELYASSALRTLALAERPVEPAARYGSSSVEKDLVFVGLVGLIDPPRPEVRGALALCQKAGIRVIMLTGDAPTTARVIAQDLGILPSGAPPAGALLSGPELEALSDEALRERVKTLSVCARATPDHKYRIVCALQDQGEVVALTGDGVNDAPSIKKANIGVAMGVGGTDVARGAADMVLLDNNFKTLVTAVDRGRSIYENIRSFVRFQFTTNVAALSLMFAAPLLGLPLPLKPLQILWINIIMDGPPALALGVEPARPDTMERPPRRPDAPFLSTPLLADIVGSGLLMFALTLAVFAAYVALEPAKAGTMAFTLFVALQLVNACSCRSFHLSALTKPFSNRPLLAAVLVSLGLHLVLIYLPAAQAIFGTVALSLADWGVVAASGLLLLIKDEVRKRFLYRPLD